MLLHQPDLRRFPQGSGGDQGADVHHAGVLRAVPPDIPGHNVAGVLHRHLGGAGLSLRLDNGQYAVHALL